MFADI